jgi:hypothetical protein
MGTLSSLRRVEVALVYRWTAGDHVHGLPDPARVDTAFRVPEVGDAL